jgi:hypothetical protein
MVCLIVVVAVLWYRRKSIMTQSTHSGCRPTFLRSDILQSRHLFERGSTKVYLIRSWGLACFDTLRLMVERHWQVRSFKQRNLNRRSTAFCKWCQVGHILAGAHSFWPSIDPWLVKSIVAYITSVSTQHGNGNGNVRLFKLNLSCSHKHYELLQYPRGSTNYSPE